MASERIATHGMYRAAGAVRERITALNYWRTDSGKSLLPHEWEQFGRDIEWLAEECENMLRISQEKRDAEESAAK